MESYSLFQIVSYFPLILMIHYMDGKKLSSQSDWRWALCKKEPGWMHMYRPGEWIIPGKWGGGGSNHTDVGGGGGLPRILISELYPDGGRGTNAPTMLSCHDVHYAFEYRRMSIKIWKNCWNSMSEWIFARCFWTELKHFGMLSGKKLELDEGFASELGLRRKCWIY